MLSHNWGQSFIPAEKKDQGEETTCSFPGSGNAELERGQDSVAGAAALVWQGARGWPGLVTIPVLLLGWQFGNKKRQSGESSGGWNFSVNPRGSKSSSVHWEVFLFCHITFTYFFCSIFSSECYSRNQFGFHFNRAPA